MKKIIPDVFIKIVFVHHPAQCKWYAFAATDAKLTAMAILNAYAQRRRIAVFLKNCKQYLNDCLKNNLNEQVIEVRVA